MRKEDRNWIIDSDQAPTTSWLTLIIRRRCTSITQSRRQLSQTAGRRSMLSWTTTQSRPKANKVRARMQLSLPARRDRLGTRPFLDSSRISQWPTFKARQPHPSTPSSIRHPWQVRRRIWTMSSHASAKEYSSLPRSLPSDNTPPQTEHIVI